jgi:hypothetical protein
MRDCLLLGFAWSSWDSHLLARVHGAVGHGRLQRSRRLSSLRAGAAVLRVDMICALRALALLPPLGLFARVALRLSRGLGLLLGPRRSRGRCVLCARHVESRCLRDF